MELTDIQIKAFLEEAQIYTWSEFTPPQVNRSSLWVAEIDSFCEVCDQVRPFQDLRPRGGGAGLNLQVKALSTGTSFLEFTCASCRNSKREFHVEQVVESNKVSLQKYGELPRKPLPRDPRLKKFITVDLELYEKGSICLANGYGIAAYTYFRRVVESNIARLIELIEADAQACSVEASVLEALGELKLESPMSEKIRVANNAMPSYLIPNGLNPLGKMYKVLSEGVHAHSDAECLKNAESLIGCLKYLVGELGDRKRGRESFARSIGGL